MTSASPSADLKVAIIGGGIAGLTTAIALHQRRIEAKVYETASSWSAVGAGIVLPSNAMEVLGKLGLAHSVQEAGSRIDLLEIRDQGGALIHSVDLRPAAEKFGAHTVAVRRSELHKVLLAAVPADCVQLNKGCECVQNRPDGVTVRFGDGSTATCDFLIAADGLRSAVRQQVAPRAKERYSGQSSYRAIVQHPVAPYLNNVCREFWGPGKRFGFACVDNENIYWYATFDAEAGGADAAEELHARLLDFSRRFPSPIPELIANTKEDQIVRTDIADLPPIRTWHKGRILLIGDAAHASMPDLGQGGAQAIEDAYVLAAQLAVEGNVEHALHRFEGIRRPRVIYVARLSRMVSKLAHISNPGVRWIRDRALRLVPRYIAQRQVEFLSLS